MQKLTKAEEDIMQLLWEVGRGTVSDLLDRCPEPKPPHSTVSSVVRILEKKGFVGHKAYGKTHEYFPLVEREVYGPPPAWPSPLRPAPCRRASATRSGTRHCAA